MHHGANHPTTQGATDESLLSRCRRARQSRDKSQTHVGTSKRRRSDSSFARVILKRKLPEVLDRARPIPPNSSSSSASENESRQSLPLETNMPECRDGKRGQYDKRQRHKTKADKYEVKTGSKSRDVGMPGNGKQRSSKRRRRKSGLVLNNEFKAPNVAQDRLTLMANGGPGMFHKGKASSLVQRRGLPDLTFPEMNFLNKRQSHPEALQQDGKDRRPKSKKKEKEKTQQISHFFGGSPAAKLWLRKPTESIQFGQSVAQMPPLSSNGSMSRDQKPEERRKAQPNHRSRRHSAPRKDYDLLCQQNHRVVDGEKPERDHQKTPLTPAPCSPQAESPSSYHSWSITPSRRSRTLNQVSRKSIDDVAQIPLSQSHHPDEHPSHADDETPDTTFNDQFANEPAHESSVSQSSLDQYTKTMLLACRQDVWNQFPAQHRATELYTLNDLKHLARLERLKATERECYTMQGDNGFQGLSSRSNVSNSDIGRSDTHQLHTFTSQSESSKTPHFMSNNGLHFPLPQASLASVAAQAKSHSVQQVPRSGKLADPSLSRRLGFNSTRHGDRFAPAGSRTTLALGRLRRNQSFERKRPDLPSPKISSARFVQLAMGRRQWKASSEQRACSRPTLDTAQQIIFDIEQEELLMSGCHHHTSEPVEDVAGVALESSSNQPSRTEFLDAEHPAEDRHILHSPEHDTTFEQDIDQTRHGDHLHDGSPPDPHQAYSPPASEDFDRPLSHPNANKSRSRQDLQKAAHFPVGCHAVHRPEQERQQDEETSLVDFWKPNNLY